MSAGVPVLCWTLVVSTALGAAAEAKGAVVEVAAGPYARNGVPVTFPLPDALRAGRSFSMEILDTRQPVPVMLLPGDPPSLVWIDRQPLAAGAKRRYRLEPNTTPGSTSETARVINDGKALEVKVGDRPVLTYHEAIVESPKGIDSIFRKSGQIHPLLTPFGLSVTDDFPPDHAHQHGLFFAWVNTTFEGNHVDFWNQKDRSGQVTHAETLGTLSGPVFGQFVVRLRHADTTGPGTPVPVLDEVWTVRVYNLADASLVDLESRQTCAGSKPLKINKYHYGGLGLRGNRQWFDPTAKGNDPPDPSKSGASDFLTSEGKTRRDGNHTRPRWVDLSGRIDGKLAGVAILDHPGNFRFPQPVRLHPNKPYFCFAPMVLGEFSIEPGQTYVSRYRILAHDGPAETAAIEHAWHDYAEPPSVQIITD
jgi:hypothetical protein